MTPNDTFPRNTYLVFAVISFLLITSTNFAQTYSPEEQSLIDQLTVCWDAWIEGIEKNDPEIWYEKCPAKPDASMWWTNEGAPQQIDWARRNWDIASSVDAKWVDIRPVAVRIWDDFGMIQFYGSWQAKSEDGLVISEYKRTELFKNENGSWIFLGGQGTPVANKDAAPYE